MEDDLVDRLIIDWGKEWPDLDAQAMQVAGRVLILGKTLVKRASNSLKDSGISYTDLKVLDTLRRSGHPYELSPKSIMGSVLITSGALTTLLGRLTKIDLIYRSPDPQDGRIKKAGLTKKGILVIDDAIKIRFDEAKDAIKNLTKKEQKELALLLKKLMSSL
jgi:DNA-binding MarR family transcriptional regulator